MGIATLGYYSNCRCTNLHMDLHIIKVLSVVYCVTLLSRVLVHSWAWVTFSVEFGMFFCLWGFPIVFFYSLILSLILYTAYPRDLGTGLDRVSVCCRVHQHKLCHTIDNLETQVSLLCISLEDGRNSEHLVETHQAHAEPANSRLTDLRQDANPGCWRFAVLLFSHTFKIMLVCVLASISCFMLSILICIYKGPCNWLASFPWCAIHVSHPLFPGQALDPRLCWPG